MPSRVYDTSEYRKHKRPEGWGSLCPDTLVGLDVQALLDLGVQYEGAIYNVDGEICFRAFEHQALPDGTTRWHGHPIPWRQLPSAAKNLLIEAGRLDAPFYRKAIRKGWGS